MPDQCEPLLVEEAGVLDSGVGGTRITAAREARDHRAWRPRELLVSSVAIVTHSAQTACMPVADIANVLKSTVHVEPVGRPLDVILSFDCGPGFLRGHIHESFGTVRASRHS